MAKKTNNKKIKYIYFVVYFFVGILLLLTAYNFYYASRILPGVYVGGQNFGGLTYNQALNKLNLSTKKVTNIKIIVDGNTYNIDSSELNLEYANNKTASTLFSTGRSSLFSHYYFIVGYFKQIKNINYNFNINEDSLVIQLASISAKEYPNVDNAYFSLDETNNLIIKDAKEGKVLNLSELKNSILTGLSILQNEYIATTKKFTPTIYSQDLQSFKPLMADVLKDKLVITYKDLTFTPSQAEILSFVKFIKNEDTKVLASINSSSVENYVIGIVFKVNKEPKSIDFSLDKNGEITNFSPPINGVKADDKKLISDLSNSLLGYFNNGEELKELSINAEEEKPSVTSNKYGITELFAEGDSYFEHSIPNRIENIKTASSKINGTLIAPGEVFSFNDSVGPITLDEGFNTAYVISKGRTILGTGGGVCQVSTTVFRAALNAGFPILERTAHAYRVGYYEQHSEIGYDASIYQPTVDLKFKNDTQNYILLYTEVNLQKSKLTVKLFGTKDGRKVEITKPVLGKQLPPPETIYEDDPTLPKGKLVQIEYAAWGGSSVFKQIVKDKDDKIKFEDEFKSYYRPWPAVFKKGTKE